MALDEIKSKFAGKWKVDRSEKFEDFLAEVGVNFLVRKMAANGHPTVIITVEDDGHITTSTQTAFWTKTDKFKLDEEFDKEIEGVKMKVKVTYEDGKLIVENTPIDSTTIKKQTVHRERVGEEMLMTMFIGDVVAKRWSKRID